jgi:putative lipoic acid-binding regulatory protein
MPPPDDSSRLDLTYPCEWRYRVIGADAATLRAAIEEIAADAEHEVREGNISRSGSYVSLELVMTVRDEDHRLGVLAKLAAHDDVRFVL